jgi:hypothetical protein
MPDAGRPMLTARSMRRNRGVRRVSSGHVRKPRGH